MKRKDMKVGGLYAFVEYTYGEPVPARLLDLTLWGYGFDYGKKQAVQEPKPDKRQCSGMAGYMVVRGDDGRDVDALNALTIPDPLNSDTLSAFTSGLPSGLHIQRVDGKKLVGEYHTALTAYRDEKRDRQQARDNAQAKIAAATTEFDRCVTALADIVPGTVADQQLRFFNYDATVIYAADAVRMPLSTLTAITDQLKAMSRSGRGMTAAERQAEADTELGNQVWGTNQ